MSEPGTWTITWGEHVWSEDDLTGAHAAMVTILSGKDAWGQLDPFAGPMTLMQILAACISLAEQRDAIEVVGELGLVPLKKLLAAVSVE